MYDDRGKAVSGARVRLAVGGESGGKAVYANTDPSGAFTLRGLRPGSSYTLIAEYQGRNGLLTGRAQAKAPNTSVKIGLNPRNAEADDARSTIRACPPQRGADLERRGSRRIGGRAASCGDEPIARMSSPRAGGRLGGRNGACDVERRQDRTRFFSKKLGLEPGSRVIRFFGTGRGAGEGESFAAGRRWWNVVAINAWQ